MMMNKDQDEDAVEVDFDARLLHRAADCVMCHRYAIVMPL